MIRTQSNNKGCLATAFRHRSRNRFDVIPAMQAAEMAEEHDRDRTRLIDQIDIAVHADMSPAKIRDEIQLIIAKYKKTRSS